MESNHVQQVAWYVSQLQKEVQIDLYSDFLAHLSHEADKKLSLSLAVENGLPMAEILSEVVRKIHDDEDDNFEKKKELNRLNMISEKIQKNSDDSSESYISIELKQTIQIIQDFERLRNIQLRSPNLTVLDARNAIQGMILTI